MVARVRCFASSSVGFACPTNVRAATLIDSGGIRNLHRSQLIESADALKDGLTEKPMQIHMQRIVGSFVGSAYGAGQFYSRAQRKGEFAADMGLQAHVLRIAAEGAVAAYEDITGETWKPYERTVEQSAKSVDREAATAQMAAFE